MHINIQQIAFIPVVFQSTGQDDYFIFECSAIVNILEKTKDAAYMITGHFLSCWNVTQLTITFGATAK